MLVDLKPSNLKLLFIIAIHFCAILSILLIADIGFIGTALKALLMLLVVVSFYRHLMTHRKNISLHFKSDNQVDLIIADQNYTDLQLSGESYISDVFLQLILLDENSGVSRNVTIFPDSLDAAMHSQLRARLKVFSDGL